MNPSFAKVLGAVVLVVLAGGIYLFLSQDREQPGLIDVNEKRNPMTFFVTSANPGEGADLGGLAGADAYCALLATNAGAGGKEWRAYLSATATETNAAINARDRIGSGPWQNAEGTVIARNVNELHGMNNLTKETALTENGALVNGRGDTVNMHDILTGSLPDGRVSTAEGDTTCRNWTSGSDGSALLGHSDRRGLDESDAAKSWNSSHPSRGCDMDSLKATGGAGLFYCFATE